MHIATLCRRQFIVGFKLSPVRDIVLFSCIEMLLLCLQEEQTEEMNMNAMEMKNNYMKISGQDQRNSEEIGVVRHKGHVLSEESENLSVNPVRQSSKTSEIEVTDTKASTDISTEQIAVINNEQQSQAKHKTAIEHTVKDKGPVYHKTGSKEVAHLEDDLDLILSLASSNDIKTEQLNDSNRHVQGSESSIRNKVTVASETNINSSETVKTDGKTLKGKKFLHDFILVLKCYLIIIIFGA